MRKKKKEGGSEKGGGMGVKIHPLHLPWIRAWYYISLGSNRDLGWFREFPHKENSIFV